MEQKLESAMARGISIKDVENKVQNINDNNVIPLSTGADVPEVVTVGVLKEHINEDVDTALEGKQDAINDLATIRSGAALGATALQDSDISDWAKAEQKPSYTASEVGAVPTTRKINNKALSSDITLTATDVNALPSSTVIPAAQIQSDWNQSNTSAKDYIKNKPEIPVLPTLADVATSGDYEDLANTPTIPNVPEWAMSSTKPSYTVSEINGAQEELVSGTNIKTINGSSVLGSGNITIQGGGGGDVNVIESITFNGSAVPVDASKNAAITYSAPVTSVNGNTGDVAISIPTKVSDLTNDSGFITSYTETDPVFSASVASSITAADITAWNGKSTFSGSYNDLTDKPTLFSGDYNDLSNKPTIPSAQVNSDWNASSGVAQILNKPTIPDVSGKENTSNKVTSLSASSTDTQYPSAKCVYDLVGDIETLLAAI